MATQELNISDLENYLKKYGFIQKTGIELSGESKGSFDSYKKCTTCLSSLSIGYSVNVTQMQMVKAYSIIANGGKDIDLTVVKSPYVNKIQNQVVSINTSERLKNLLINVVEGENGTGRSLRMDNYKIGGKTGTSRTHIEGIGYSDYRFNTSFTGFIERCAEWFSIKNHLSEEFLEILGLDGNVQRMDSDIQEPYGYYKVIPKNGNVGFVFSLPIK